MEPQQKDNLHRPRTKVAIWFGVVFVVVFGGYHLYYYLFPTPEDQVKALLKETCRAVDGENPMEALAFVSEAYQDSEGRGKDHVALFAAWGVELYKQIRITLCDLRVTILDFDHAVVNVGFKIRCVPRIRQLYNGPVTGSVLLGTEKEINEAKVRLRREDGEWRITSIWVEGRL